MGTVCRLEPKSIIPVLGTYINTTKMGVGKVWESWFGRANSMLKFNPFNLLQDDYTLSLSLSLALRV